MLALFLDESGIFEEKEEPILLNAGLVYKGQKLTQDIKNLQSFLNKLCKQFGLVYPDGLHGSEIRNYTIKRQIQISLLNFLAQQNSWSIIGIIGGDYEQDKRSNIVNEKTASNLYRNMLVRLLDNTLYYTSLSENERQAQLHIASRVAIISADDNERHQQYEELGYRRKRNNDDSFRYYIIDERVISAVLGQLYKERVNPPQLDFQLYVKSIYREKNVGLMAADLICNYLYGQINRRVGDMGLNKLVAGLQSYNLNSYLWVYDQADDKYRILSNMQFEGNLYEYLVLRNQFFTESYGIAQYYASRWIPKPPDITLSVLEKAIRILNDRRKNPDIDYPQELRIVEQLNHLVEKDMSKIPLKNIYQLYDLMLQLNNHIGNPEQALVCGKKAIQVLKQQPRSRNNYQRRLETCVRMSGVETNRFHFQGAIRILNDELAPRLESRLKLEVDDFGPLIDSTLGKCYSALGQNYAFLRKNRKALKMFQRSLEHFADEPGNAEITTNHILHLALAMRDMDLFKQYAPSFFNDPAINNTISRNEKSISICPLAGSKDKGSFPKWLLQYRWQSAMENSNPFKLLVLLKAINLMELWKEAGMLERILNADYSARFVSNDSHPWEFIYRHMAEIAFKAGLQKSGQDLVKKSVAVAAPRLPLTFQVVHLGTRMMADSYLYQEKELARCYLEKIEELKQICLNAPENTRHIYSQDNPDSWFYDCVINADSKFSSHKKVRIFLDRFTYAYR